MNEFLIFYCLIGDGTVVGTVALKKIDDKTAELKSLYLDKDLRGQGWGSKLMQNRHCHGAVCNRSKEGNGPVGTVPSTQGNLVAFDYTAILEHDMQLLNLPSHIMVL